MKQQAQSTTTPRVYTARLVTIGQVWELRTRKKVKPTIKILQVYRHDRQVRAETDAGDVVPIDFGVLRRKYKLIYDTRTTK